MARKANTETTEVEAEVTDNTISAKALAEELGIDAKAFRRWLRKHTTNRAGKGGRWTFLPEEVSALKAAFLKAEAEATEVQAAEA